jgi:hypothetical protein
VKRILDRDGSFTTTGASSKLAPEVLTRATRAVASASHGPVDARALLEMLGLVQRRADGSYTE